MNKKDIFIYCLMLILPIFLVLFIGKNGLEDSDSGFLVGMGWRILNGELPYKDFYYVRPPLSPYISALFLYLTPEYSQIFFLRLINNYQLLFQIIITLTMLNRCYNFKEIGLNFGLFFLFCFLITSMGTLYFQWHTTDGIFLAVLGFYFLYMFKDSRFINFHLFFAGIFLAFSALTKQNFLLVPIIGIFFTFLEYGFRKFVFVFSGIFSIFILFYFYLYHYDLLNFYFIQSTGSTSFEDLLFSGFFAYFNFGKFPILSILLYIVASFFLLKTAFNFSSFNIFFYCFLLFSLVVFNLYYFILFKINPFSILFDRLLFVFSFFLLIYFFIFHDETINKHKLIICLLMISWASSISWGAMSPLMFFTPVLFLFYYLSQKYFQIFNKKSILFSFCVLFFYSFIVNFKPYRDDFIWNLNNNAGSVSKKLEFIYSSDSIFLKHQELKSLLKKYDNTTILPSMPGAYYIHGLSNCLAVDWAMDVEVGYDRLGLIRDLDCNCNVVFMEKRVVGAPIGNSGKFYSSISDYVKSNYCLIDNSYSFFDVYVK